jgi:hypothetical protein
VSAEELKTAAEAAALRLLAYIDADAIPPVNVRELAFQAGVQAIYVDDEMLGDGRLERQDGRTVIALGPRSGSTRGRYTVAHELGHHWLREHEPMLLSRLSQPDEERFCNMFAAALLLPPEWVAEQGNAQPPTLARLREIATIADVSLVACFISLRQLPQWRKSLLHWRRYEGTWRLNSMVGVAEAIRDELRASPQAAHAIGVVARLPNAEATCDFPLELGGVAITARAEVAVMSDGAIALMELPKYGERVDRSRRPAEPFSLLAFALPRTSERTDTVTT